MLHARKGDFCDLITASRLVVFIRILVKLKLLVLGRRTGLSAGLGGRGRSEVWGLMTTTGKGLSKLFLLARVRRQGINALFIIAYM